MKKKHFIKYTCPVSGSMTENNQTMPWCGYDKEPCQWKWI